jgi:YaiO family outer membrane protein
VRRGILALALLAAWTAASAQSPVLADARARVDARDFAAAAALLERHLATAPQDAEARYLLARVYAWSGEPARALPIYRELLVDEPDNGDYLLGYGQALLWSGDAHAAVDVLERAQRIAPAYVEVADALAKAQATVADPSTSGSIATPPSPVAASSAGTVAGAPMPSAGSIPAPAPRDRRSVAVSARRDRLDRGLDDWTSLRLDAVSIPLEGTGAYGALVSERRFGLRDAGVEAGAVVRFAEGWTFQPEVGVVGGAEFLPRHYVDLRLQRDFGAGWVGGASLRHSDFRDVDVQRLALGIERYAGTWRMGYTLSIARLEGRHTTGHDVRLVRAYGERSEIGLQLGTGREAALVGTSVLASDVRAATLFGRHALGDWAVLWNAGRVQQGDFYTREGVGLGLERRF